MLDSKILLVSFSAGLPEIIRKDSLIQEFAYHQIQRLGSRSDQRPSDVNNVRNKLRVLARLLKMLQPVQGKFIPLSTFITP